LPPARRSHIADRDAHAFDGRPIRRPLDPGKEITVTDAPSIHHTVVLVRDIERSLAFYTDGLGLEVLQDRTVEGDWPGLFGAPTRSLRAVFLGNPSVPDIASGVLELNVFEREPAGAEALSAPAAGVLMLSYFVDVEATLARLATLGLGGVPSRVDQSTPTGPISLAVVTDPDGVRILLTPGSITRG
jgi:catechol 2,3-dioxygenase-like lactoylglutathione lyase family enzyme